MKPLQNTLYVLTPDSYLFWENECIGVKVGGEEKVRVPSHTIESILCFGNATVSTPLIRFCGERGISISFLSENGQFYGRTYGPVSGNILLRQRQFLVNADPIGALSYASGFLCGKLYNEKTVLLRAARETTIPSRETHLRQAANQISNLGSALGEPTSLNTIRGIEGAAAQIYFSCFDDMLHAKDSQIRFDQRSRRPPKNEVNAALSFVYTLLKNDTQAALEAVGLDPACGFLHTLRPGRPALALDLMEELRAPLCDRLVLALFNRGQLRSRDFRNEAGQILLSDKARRLVLSSWQARKRETIMHPFLKERISIGVIPFSQATLLARTLRGDLDTYPPFAWR